MLPKQPGKPKGPKTVQEFLQKNKIECHHQNTNPGKKTKHPQTNSRIHESWFNYPRIQTTFPEPTHLPLPHQGQCQPPTTTDQQYDPGPTKPKQNTGNFAGYPTTLMSSRLRKRCAQKDKRKETLIKSVERGINLPRRKGKNAELKEKQQQSPIRNIRDTKKFMRTASSLRIVDQEDHE